MADSNANLDKLAGDYKVIADKFGAGLQGKVAIVTGSNTGEYSEPRLPPPGELNDFVGHPGTQSWI